jgi:hypothetical protein
LRFGATSPGSTVFVDSGVPAAQFHAEAGEAHPQHQKCRRLRHRSQECNAAITGGTLPMGTPLATITMNFH